MSCLDPRADSALLVYCHIRQSVSGFLSDHWSLVWLFGGLLLFALLLWRRLGWRVGREQAERRAEELLRATLPAAQYHALQRMGYLELHSRLYPSRRYHIPRHRGRVEVFELQTTSPSPFWRKIAELCVIPTEPMPDADLVLAHKWLIEADESTYLAIANWIRVPYNPWAA